MFMHSDGEHGRPMVSLLSIAQNVVFICFDCLTAFHSVRLTGRLGPQCFLHPRL